MTHAAYYRNIIARMGYYEYQNGLIYNYLRQDGLWESHLSNCRRKILESVDQLKPDTVTILGSGWLLDTPLAELIERSCKVNLVDIVHPPEVISQTRELNHVTLIEADVTGGLIDAIWNLTKGFYLFKKKLDIESVGIPVYKPDFYTGFIVSMNILTQLESRLLALIEKRNGLKRNELVLFRSGIQEKHIEFLRQHDSLLITDYEERTVSRSGLETVDRTLLADLAQGDESEKWSWEFDLTGQENYNSTITFMELAIRLRKNGAGKNQGRVSE